MLFPTEFDVLPSKQALIATYGGKEVCDLPTPSLIIDREKFVSNSNAMLRNAADLGVDFRVHVKTHKTREGVQIQLGSESEYSTRKVIVSTTREAWSLMPLVTSGAIDDIHYSLPLVTLRVSELAELNKHVTLRLMIDNIEQIRTLEAYGGTWSIFLKVDMGTHRAGLPTTSPEFQELIAYSIALPFIEIYGFYCHAGHSYGLKSIEASKEMLLTEIEHANAAAKLALSIDPSLKLTLSVGATPTAHASQVLTKEEIQNLNLSGELELHAGNYSCCDLQQVATACVPEENVSISVLAEIVSTYPDRREQLINAGCVALSRESGPIPGFGKIQGSSWIVGRLSQEHGILVNEDENLQFIPIGEKILITPQHACITASCHPWFFAVENGVVVDVWIPARGW